MFERILVHTTHAVLWPSFPVAAEAADLKLGETQAS